MDNSSCPHCLKKFFNRSARNRHIKTVHKVEIELKKKNSLIFCPLCSSDGNREGMATYIVLIGHLKDKHDVTVEEERLTFSGREDFEKWRQLEYRNVDYKIARTEDNVMLYFCNRSNYKGSRSNCSKRSKRKRGSIKIDGICPARIKAKFHFDGHVEVHYVKTHVGHQEEVRARCLTHKEQKEFAEEMRAGASLDKILEDVKKIPDGKVERKNVMTKMNLRYIKKKFNVETSRDLNDMAPTAIKVKEWNSNDENYEFMFKEIGVEIESEESDSFCIEGMSEEKLKLWEVENEFINEKYQDLNNKENEEENIDEESCKKILLQDFKNQADSLMNLDITTLKKVVEKFTTIINQFLPSTVTKRKMEKQSYPQTRKKQRK